MQAATAPVEISSDGYCPQEHNILIIMWKTLNPGERVTTGDTIRYRLGASRFTASPDVLYVVVKTDQHYFEVAVRTDEGKVDKTDRKIIKYMDVGYHIKLEVWSGKSPFRGRITEMTPE
jgi:hypothetical protein